MKLMVLRTTGTILASFYLFYLGVAVTEYYQTLRLHSTAAFSWRLEKLVDSVHKCGH